MKRFEPSLWGGGTCLGGGCQVGEGGNFEVLESDQDEAKVLV